MGDDANPTTDVEKKEPWKEPAAELCQEHSCAGVGTVALIAPQILLRLQGIEVERLQHKGLYNKPCSKPHQMPVGMLAGKRGWPQGAAGGFCVFLVNTDR